MMKAGLSTRCHLPTRTLSWTGVLNVTRRDCLTYFHPGGDVAQHSTQRLPPTATPAEADHHSIIKDVRYCKRGGGSLERFFECPLAPSHRSRTPTRKWLMGALLRIPLTLLGYGNGAVGV
jgi:hypothetical protein